MQLSQLLINFLTTFWYFIPIAILLVIIKTPWFKGVFGEFIVNCFSKIFLNKNEYHLIKNVTLPTDNGTTQIDHVIVSKYGIFVVETKNMKGWIFGNSNQKMWTQKIFKHSSKFQNPLHQNYKHVKTIETLLGLKPNQIHSVVVFIGDSTFKTKMPDNVTQSIGYIKFIKSKKETVFTDYELKIIIKEIEQGRLSPSFKTHREHVKHVKSIIADKQSASTPICPKCGSSMILREAKKGENAGTKFWGCSNFPKCKVIVPLRQDSCNIN